MTHGLIAGPELVQLIEEGVIDALPENVNGASIDVRIADEVLVERLSALGNIVDLDAKENITFVKERIGEAGLLISPGQCFLAHTMETLALPDTIACEFKLRSSVARCFLNHALAGWADPGFHGTLTLEFTNQTRYHFLRVRPGMRIGQLVFFRHADAERFSYRHKGRYNGQTTVQASKGV